MPLQHIRCKTRIDLARSIGNLNIAWRAYITTPRRPLSNLTRPCAKPRAFEATWCQKPQNRGAKKQVTVELSDMPQGVITTNALPPQQDDEPDYPPLLQQVRNNMLKFSHCVLVTRVGGFYEVCVHFLTFSLVDASSCTLNMQTSMLRFST